MKQVQIKYLVNGGPHAFILVKDTSSHYKYYKKLFILNLCIINILFGELVTYFSVSIMSYSELGIIAGSPFSPIENYLRNLYNKH